MSGNGTLGDHGSIAGELMVDAGSIDTKNKRRDKHLRSAECFDVSKYPTLTFTASEVAPAADGTLKINGALRIRDQSQPIELVAVPTNPSPDRVTLNAQATLDRSDWECPGGRVPRWSIASPSRHSSSGRNAPGVRPHNCS